MPQKIMTKYEILVIEYDSTGYYYPKYKTNQTIIAESLEQAKEEAIKRTPLRHSGGSWVRDARVIKSEDIVIDV